MKLYSIRPLNWENRSDYALASVPGCRFYIGQLTGSDKWVASCSGDRDATLAHGVSLEAAKAACEAHWQQTLSACLEESQEVERLKKCEEALKSLIPLVNQSYPMNRERVQVAIALTSV